MLTRVRVYDACQRNSNWKLGGSLCRHVIMRASENVTLCLAHAYLKVGS